MPSQNEPVISAGKAEQGMTSLKEANARQKESLDRLLGERKEMLDVLYSLTMFGENSDQYNKAEDILVKNGYFE